MLTSRKVSAKHAKHLFFKEHNDISFFIEDKDKVTKKIFFELLTKRFPNLKLNNIFPLGGRIEVVNECRKAKEKSIKEKSIYIVDGDIYLLAGEFNENFNDVSDLEKLFILPRYCIENYLLEENSLVDLLDDEDETRVFDELKGEFLFDDWLEKHCDLFKDLYIHFALAMKLELSIPTISEKIKPIVSSGTGDLDEGKVKAKIANIKSIIIESYDIEKYDYEHNLISNNISDGCNFIMKYVSGKDHLFPLLYMRANKVTRITSRHDNLKIRLSKKVSGNVLEELYQFSQELYSL